MRGKMDSDFIALFANAAGRASGVISRLLLLALVFALGACATPDHSLKHKNLGAGGTRELPKKVLFIAPDVRIKEISAGGMVEEVPEWTQQSNSHVRSSFTSIARELELAVIAPPTLPAANQEVVDQHIALYDLVAGNAFHAVTHVDPAWTHKRQAFDYTLGPGLSFLGTDSGADAALFIVGADFVSTSGRKAAMVIGALFGVAIPMGFTYLTAGVVDLASGDLLWLSYEIDPSTNLRESKEADNLMRKLFAKYPGAARK